MAERLSSVRCIILITSAWSNNLLISGGKHQVQRTVSRRRLIFHVGSPKTGTSSLQRYLTAARAELKSRGILYPATGLSESTSSKHQWLVNALLANDERELDRRMHLIEEEAEDDIGTIILSTEGIFNHWWDFPSQSRRWFGRMKECFDVSAWVWLREPTSFFKSYYLQLMRNPPVQDGYGRDLSVSELFNNSWVMQHLKYKAFCIELESILGAGGLYVFAYKESIVQDACKLLSLPIGPEPHENVTSLNDVAVSILRVINRYHLSSDDKEAAYRHAIQIGSIIASQSDTFKLSPEERDVIKKACDMSEEALLEMNWQSIVRWFERTWRFGGEYGLVLGGAAPEL